MSNLVKRKATIIRRKQNRVSAIKGNVPSSGQLRLLRRYGIQRLTAEKLESLKLSHERYLAQASFVANPSESSKGISLPEAERLVEAYLETL